MDRDYNDRIHKWICEANYGWYDLKNLTKDSDKFISAVKEYIEKEMGDYKGSDVYFNQDYTRVKKIDVRYLYKNGLSEEQKV